MIKVYENGKSFYEDNKSFLSKDPYVEVFFRLDSDILNSTNKEEYALKVVQDEHILVCLLKSPYGMLLMGEKELVPELITFLISNNYKIHDYLCREEIGDYMLNFYKEKGINFKCNIKMDFMECKKCTKNSSNKVEVATENDIEELYKMSLSFIKDCGLNDEVNKENIIKTYNAFRIIRVNNEIVAMAKTCESTKFDKKVACVYTKPKFRGCGFAKQIVATICNEVIDSGLYATLNVDQNNPIPYHVYTSLGFRKVFTQGIYYTAK